MFNFDIFPEDSYDPSSGEYNARFDFEPIDIGQVLLTESGKTYVRVLSFDDDTTEAERIIGVLRELVIDEARFEPDYNPNNPAGYPDVPLELNHNDKKHTRGPFFLEQVRRFLKRTGLEPVSEVYYDEELDAYWIEIDTP